MGSESDWSTGPVCCDQSTGSSVFRKHTTNEIQHTTNTTQPSPVPVLCRNHLNDVTSLKKTQDYNGGFLRNSAN